jgi:hypothetical protein
LEGSLRRCGRGEPARYARATGEKCADIFFFNANHAGNVVTRRSHTGILIYVQNAPIIWYSKKQTTVKASTFGSELAALQVAKDLIVALQIRLKMFGCL